MPLFLAENSALRLAEHPLPKQSTIESRLDGGAKRADDKLPRQHGNTTGSE